MPKDANPKSPSRPTVKRLFALSGNACAFPGCSTPLVDKATGAIVGEVCHIKGEKPLAARYDETQEDSARHGFENLILMCNVHHKIIDDSEEKYPAALILQWKSDHESRKGIVSISDDDTAAFIRHIEVQGIESFNVLHAPNVSGGQVASNIVNHYDLPNEASTPSSIELEAKVKVSFGVREIGCPYLLVKVVCRSKRPAKIASVQLGVRDHGIMASLQAGFGESLKHDAVPGMEEELIVNLFPCQPPNLPGGLKLELDDSAEFLLPALAAPIGYFTLRPAEKLSLKAVLLDDTELVLTSGESLKSHLEFLLKLAQSETCVPNFPPVSIHVRAFSRTPPDYNVSGVINEKAVKFGYQIGDVELPAQEESLRDEQNEAPWYKRNANWLSYPEVHQESLPHCVYIAISSACNHLLGRQVWNGQSLLEEHKRLGGRKSDFGVIHAAKTRTGDQLEFRHHVTDQKSDPLRASKVRKWLDENAVVILSMEQCDENMNRLGRWHMFSIVGCHPSGFQVWDTNGLRGIMTEADIESGFAYPNGWRFMPHEKQDCLVIRRLILRTST